jgi:serine/threonine protein kinase
MLYHHTPDVCASPPPAVRSRRSGRAGDYIVRKRIRGPRGHFGSSCAPRLWHADIVDSSPTPSPNTGTRRAWPIYKEVGADVVGDVFDGRYQIVRRLAKGGMADVFLAKDRTRKCYVAIKLLRTSSPDAIRRFELEAEVLSNVQHANVVRTVAFGRAPDGQPYLALEYLDGEALSRRLARGPLPWREVAELGVQIASALHALHVSGVIHRDVKPHNIILAIGDDRTIPKLIDLGLASVGAPFHDVQDARFTSQVAERRKTRLGHRIGTPAYLPPEAGMCDADPRLDVYSLGVTLYQCATGLLPEPTGARPLHEVHPASDAPTDLSRLLLSALDPDADARLPSAEHLRRGLEAILAMHPRTATSAHLFGGSYDRLEILGTGANAVVFRASDRWLSREVALKVMRTAEPSEDDAIRFRRAAKILRALEHPNIPRILHFGVDDGQHFAVTELCSGEPATHFVQSGRHLRVDEVLAVGRQLASALAAVHAAGVVYRDLHVGNVLIARGETPKAWIFDFDQAQVSPAFYARLTERYATPPEERQGPANEKPLRRNDYAAPEVQAGGVHTTASDVFTLGLLLYRLLTGARPFPPWGGEPTPARKVCPACPAGLEQLLGTMLDADPRKRPTLAWVQETLESEQEQLDELAAERNADTEPAPAEVDVPPPAATVPPAELAAASGERLDVAASEAAPVAPPNTAAALEVPATAPTAVGMSVGAPVAASRVRRLLLLALLVAASAMLGRASVPTPGDAPTVSNTAPPATPATPASAGNTPASDISPPATNTPPTSARGRLRSEPARQEAGPVAGAAVARHRASGAGRACRGPARRCRPQGG